MKVSVNGIMRELPPQKPKPSIDSEIKDLWKLAFGFLILGQLVIPIVFFILKMRYK